MYAPPPSPSLKTLKNKLRLDESPQARMAASEALNGTLAGTVMVSPTLDVKCDGSVDSGGPAVVSLLGMHLLAFSLSMLSSAWANIHSLDLSHNELCEVPGLEMLPELRVLDLSHNKFKVYVYMHV
jgi:Leucine-rich repeat (LRR) protein